MIRPQVVVLRALVLLGTVAAHADPYLTPAPPEVVFSQALQDKAAELGHDPVRIFEFVRNELEYQVYWGMMKGPEGTLVARGGNDVDLASVLVTLLRISGYPARFVHGRIQIPATDAIAMTGADSRTAAWRYWRLAEPLQWQTLPAGNPAGVAEDSATDSIFRFHVWVEAQLPLARYRGAGADSRGVAWIPLDPASKLREVRPGISLPIGTDPALTLDYLAPDGVFRSPDERDIAEVLEDKIQAYLATNHQGSSLADVAVLGRIVPQTPGILPTALPYEQDTSFPSYRSANLNGLGVSSDLFHYAAGLVICPSSLGMDTCRDDGIAEIRDLQAGIPPTPNPAILGIWWAPAAEADGQRVTLTFPPVDPAQVPATGYVSCPNIQTQPTVRVNGIVATTTSSTITACLDLKVVVVALPALDAVNGLTVYSPHSISAVGTNVLHLDLHNAGPERTRSLGIALANAEASIRVRDDPNGTPYVDTIPNDVKDPTEVFLAQDFDAQEQKERRQGPDGGLSRPGLRRPGTADRKRPAHGEQPLQRAARARSHPPGSLSPSPAHAPSGGRPHQVEPADRLPLRCAGRHAGRWSHDRHRRQPDPQSAEKRIGGQPPCGRLHRERGTYGLRVGAPHLGRGCRRRGGLDRARHAAPCRYWGRAGLRHESGRGLGSAQLLQLRLHRS